MRVLSKACLLSVVMCIFASTHEAQAQNPVSWSVNIAPAQSIVVGGKIRARLSAQIAAGWHVYSITQGPGGPVPTRITLSEGQPFRLAGRVSGPRPRVQMDTNFQINTETYESGATFSIPIAVQSNAQPGAQSIEVEVEYQACNDHVCLPPRTLKLTAAIALNVAPTTTATVPTANNDASATLPSSPQGKRSSPTPVTRSGTRQVVDLSGPNVVEAQSNRSNIEISASPSAHVVQSRSGLNGAPALWSFIWLAMSMGALSLLTPCVFPMIPITVSYFTRHAAGRRAVAARDAVIYAIGIILTFTALGVTLALLFGAAGINRFAANPWVNTVIALIFLGFALSLFGAFTLQVPSKLLTRLDGLTREKDGKGGRHIVAVLLMGVTFSLTSFTCTAPFVGTLLVMVTQGHWLYPVLGMLAFSIVFALPFFALALIPQLVSQLPKSGGWLNGVKVVMGLIEIAAAMKFMSNADLVWGWGIFTRGIVLATWVAVSVMVTLYLLGKFQLTHDTYTERIGAIRLMIALIFLSMGFFILTGLFGGRLGELEAFLPPAMASTTLAKNETSPIGELKWIVNDYESALARAREEHKPVLIDFTGYTCTNCRWMEANMFTQEEVKREMGKYVRTRLYTDGEGAVYKKQQQLQQEKFGTVALPLYALLDGDGKVLDTFAGLTRDESAFLAFLRSGVARSAAPQ